MRFDSLYSWRWIGGAKIPGHRAARIALSDGNRTEPGRPLPAAHLRWLAGKSIRLPEKPPLRIAGKKWPPCRRGAREADHAQRHRHYHALQRPDLRDPASAGRMYRHR